MIIENNEKIDRRHHYILMLDTETANTFSELVTLKNGQQKEELITKYSLFYDLGFAVIDTHGKIYETGSYVNKDVFYDMEELMTSAYYGWKMPLYYAELEMGLRKESTTIGLKRIIAKVINKYQIKHICAHNSRFDLNTCNMTLRYITKSKYRYFFPYGTEIWDSLKMAKSVIAPMPSYKKFCEKYEYITPKTKQVKLTAEVLYRFISRDNNFDEKHMGIDDVLIEAAIVAYCYRQHKKMEKRLFAE